MDLYILAGFAMGGVTVNIAYGVAALLSGQLLVDLAISGETAEGTTAKPAWASAAGHAGLHGAVAWLLLADGAAWPLALLVAISHGLVDAVSMNGSGKGLAWFLLDQTVHLVIAIGGLLVLSQMRAAPLDPFWLKLMGLWALRGLIVVAGACTAVFLGAEVVGGVVAPLRPQFDPRPDRTAATPGDASDHPNRGFQEGGRMIGMLERALIFLLVLIGQSAGIGFLVAAKSIFRFGELRQRSNRLEAEYILIGTLASFLWGLLIASLTVFFLSLIS